MSTTSDDLLVSSADGVTTLTFNRPERKNALTVAMYERALLALQMAATDPLVRVVLFTGTGDSFTSGNDVTDFMNTPPNGADSPVFQFLLALVNFEKPIVVAVNGTAVGIGVTMLQHVDVVYVADNAKLKMPFVTLGLCAEGASTYLLTRMAGHAKAAELLLFGDAFDADTAVEVGLASTKLPAGELLHYATERAKILANERPLGSLLTTKRLMRAAVKEPTLKALHEEAIEFAKHLASDEAREAFSAFFEKRTPDFAQFNK